VLVASDASLPDLPSSSTGPIGEIGKAAGILHAATGSVAGFFAPSDTLLPAYQLSAAAFAPLKLGGVRVSREVATQMALDGKRVLTNRDDAYRTTMSTWFPFSASEAARAIGCWSKPDIFGRQRDTFVPIVTARFDQLRPEGLELILTHLDAADKELIGKVRSKSIEYLKEAELLRRALRRLHELRKKRGVDDVRARLGWRLDARQIKACTDLILDGARDWSAREAVPSIPGPVSPDEELLARFVSLMSDAVLADATCARVAHEVASGELLRRLDRFATTSTLSDVPGLQGANDVYLHGRYTVLLSERRIRAVVDSAVGRRSDTLTTADWVRIRDWRSILRDLLSDECEVEYKRALGRRF